MNFISATAREHSNTVAAKNTSDLRKSKSTCPHKLGTKQGQFSQHFVPFVHIGLTPRQWLAEKLDGCKDIWYGEMQCGMLQCDVM